MHTISPGIRLHVAEHALRDGMDLVSLRYSFIQDQQVSNAYRSTNVGFGLTYSLPIFVAVLSSRPGSLILLENPEAHLHPKGQSRLGEFLAIAASQGIQIVAETHSDHVLNGVRVAVHQGNYGPAIHVFIFFNAVRRMQRPLRKCYLLCSMIEADLASGLKVFSMNGTKRLKCLYN